MNLFLDPNAHFAQLSSQSRRFYVRIDKFDTIPPMVQEQNWKRQRWQVILDGVDADWFDSSGQQCIDQLHRQNVQNDFFNKVPLLALELTLRTDDMLEEGPFFFSQNGTMPDDGDWFAISLSNNIFARQARLYANLFSDGISVHVDEPIKIPSITLQNLLGTVFSLDCIPDATSLSIEQAISSHAPVGVVVHDVGQGNSNAIVDAKGRPLTYFDFGAAVYANRKTRPNCLTQFCFCAEPSIILSHWDSDHWAAGNIDKASLTQTWIVPRQKLGATHRTFAQQIIANGKLLIWPPTLQSIVSPYALVEKCTGNGRNNSGLAVIARASQQDIHAPHCLLPGDASYGVIPSHSSFKFTFVVSPHHGGDTRDSWAPACPSCANARLVHSFGTNNTYGHPSPTTRASHHAVGWIDSAVISTASAELVRETKKRKNGVGHIFLPWYPQTGTPIVTCCGNGYLTATQT
jgi:beta-lactamase superfamily II metal-dependent hydrolase